MNANKKSIGRATAALRSLGAEVVYIFGSSVTDTIRLTVTAKQSKTKRLEKELSIAKAAVTDRDERIEALKRKLTKAAQEIKGVNKRANYKKSQRRKLMRLSEKPMRLSEKPMRIPERPRRLSEKLRQIRMQAGLTHIGMIKALNYKAPLYPAAISLYESGLREPSLAVLLAYARVGGVSVDTLIDDSMLLKSE